MCTSRCGTILETNTLHVTIQFSLSSKHRLFFQVSGFWKGCIMRLSMSHKWQLFRNNLWNSSYCLIRQTALSFPQALCITSFNWRTAELTKLTAEPLECPRSPVDLLLMKEELWCTAQVLPFTCVYDSSCEGQGYLGGPLLDNWRDPICPRQN
jgi:hypothetical protein